MVSNGYDNFSNWPGRFDGRIQFDIDSNDDRNNVINWGLNDDWLIIYQYVDAFIDEWHTNYF